MSEASVDWLGELQGGTAGSREISSRMRFMIRDSREFSCGVSFMPTDALMSSLSSGEMLRIVVAAGRLDVRPAWMKTLRIFRVPAQRIEWTRPLGIQMPRLGGTVHWHWSVYTTMTPSIA